MLDGTPDFIKSIPVDKALDDNTLIAYAMNGAALPHYNGFPIRLIVPGLDRHLLDEAPQFDRGLDQAVRRLLDERRLSIQNGMLPVVQRYP